MTASMRIFNKLNSWFTALSIVIIVAISTFSGCTTIADYTLGEELAPGHQQMVIRHRLYKSGMLKETDKEATACQVFQTRLFKTDSVGSASLGKLYIGYQKDATFGSREFGFTSQLLHASGIVDDSTGFGYRPVLDSVMFVFAIDTFAGDTTKPVLYNIYELKNNLVPADAEDTIFFVNYDPRREGVIANNAEPIFTFKFPDPENGVYTNSTGVRLQETAATKAFIDRLMCRGKLDSNGLANDNVEAYGSDSAFVYNFPGLHIEVAEIPEGEGSAFSMSSSSSGLRLLGRTRNAGHDADILADTIDVVYSFKIDYADNFGNVSAQSVTYDYADAELGKYAINETEAERDVLSLGYVDGCGGAYTELTFTDEFLYSLREIHGGDETYVSAAINQAALKIYIDGSVYDYSQLDPIPMAEKMNSSLTRLGLYTDYKTLSPVPDYLYTQESVGSIYYNGYINRSLACYEMNISSYMQGLVNEVLNLKEEANGKLDFSKMSVPRTLYLAPAATDRFSLSRSIVQGCDADKTQAAIQLELTYTLVK